MNIQKQIKNLQMKLKLKYSIISNENNLNNNTLKLKDIENKINLIEKQNNSKEKNIKNINVEKNYR